MLLAALYLALGVANLFATDTDVARLGPLEAGLIGFVPAAVIAAGLWAQRRAPWLGGTLVLAGGIPMAILMVWTAIVPILAVLLVTCAARSARDLARTRRTVG